MPPEENKIKEDENTNENDEDFQAHEEESEEKRDLFLKYFSFNKNIEND
jgi:hypothetical protein